MKLTKSFWDYSIHVYRQHGVADAFLELQNKHGADVNMLLYCCWFGIARGRFNDKVFNAALGFSSAWSTQVVKPLRSARTWLKQTGCQGRLIDSGSCMEFRDKIKGIELHAEKLQQTTIESLGMDVPAIDLSIPAQLDAVVENLKCYFAAAEIDINNIALKNLELIIAVSVEGIESGLIRKALSK